MVVVVDGGRDSNGHATVGMRERIYHDCGSHVSLVGVLMNFGLQEKKSDCCETDDYDLIEMCIVDGDSEDDNVMVL